MESFEKKIKKIKNKKLTSIIGVSIILFILLVIFLVEIFVKEKSPGRFNKNSEENTYVTSEVTYLIGPILNTRNRKKEFSYYIAKDTDGQTFIIKLERQNNKIPVLGRDITKDEIDNLCGIEIKGTNEKLSLTLKETIIESINLSIANIISDENYPDELIGDFYFNASNVNPLIRNLIELMGLFLIMDLIYVLIYIRTKKNTDKSINKLKEDGIYEDVKKEYESNSLIRFEKLNVCITNNYILYYLNSLTIIPFSTIKEVHATKKINNERTKYKIICIETKDGNFYYIAPLQKRNQKLLFDELLEKIKSRQK